MKKFIVELMFRGDELASKMFDLIAKRGEVYTSAAKVRKLTSTLATEQDTLATHRQDYFLIQGDVEKLYRLEF